MVFLDQKAFSCTTRPPGGFQATASRCERAALKRSAAYSWSMHRAEGRRAGNGARYETQTPRDTRQLSRCGGPGWCVRSTSTQNPAPDIARCAEYGVSTRPKCRYCSDWVDIPDESFACRINTGTNEVDAGSGHRCPLFIYIQCNFITARGGGRVHP